MEMTGVTTREDGGGPDTRYEKTKKDCPDDLYLVKSEYTYAGELKKDTALQQAVVTRVLTLFTFSRVAPVPVGVSA